MIVALLVLVVAGVLYLFFRPDRSPYGQLKALARRRVKALRKRHPHFGTGTFYFYMGEEAILLCIPRDTLCYRKDVISWGASGLYRHCIDCPAHMWPDLLLTVMERWPEIERIANEQAQAEVREAQRRRNEQEALDRRAREIVDGR